MPVLDEEVRLRCEQCGTLLESDTLGCLNCLLGGGLVELGEEHRRFQHYELCLREDESTLDELGRGAMGITYRASDLNLESLVALKMISAAYSEKPEARDRFRREARAAAQLRHPNVASVFHFGETVDGQCFYAMELVEGETLEARVRRAGPLQVSAALDVAEQVARALVAAEGHGLVHRDLKPSNLMIVSHEVSLTDVSLVKVIDFGLAKAAMEQAVAPGFSGTPEFASPEQFNASSSLDARSDIYSLGVALWYLLCGQPPFSGEVAHDAVAGRKLPLGQLAKAKVPPPLVALLRSTLATDPSQRPQSARELLSAVRRCREVIERKPRRRNLALTGVALLLIAAAGFELANYRARRQRNAEGTGANTPPEKSIAVLPFENLSDEKEHAFFADGVQDDILTKLAKIADLKVISRSSVMSYRGKQNVREIGNALQVSHVLEGTVRRSGSKLHVNAQLVDTRTDQDIWADEYDRDLNDVFAVETEMAQSVANRLGTRLSARERAAIQERPTKNLAAYDFYVRALPALEVFASTENPKGVPQAVDLLNQAVARDPEFLLAYYRLANAQDWLYYSTDRNPARLAQAKAAIDSAFRVNPNSGEAHLALAIHCYWGYFDYDHARAELAIARRTLPNNPRVYEISAWIDRRQGRWPDAVRNLERASELIRAAFPWPSPWKGFVSVRAPCLMKRQRRRWIGCSPSIRSSSMPR